MSWIDMSDYADFFNGKTIKRMHVISPASFILYFTDGTETKFDISNRREGRTCNLGHEHPVPAILVNSVPGVTIQNEAKLHRPLELPVDRQGLIKKATEGNDVCNTAGS